jgi:hypothetical protein
LFAPAAAGQILTGGNRHRELEDLLMSLSIVSL